MSTPIDMLVIKDASGAVIAAQVAPPEGAEVVCYIVPAQDDHTLHRVSDVPSEIHGLDDPDAFQRAITQHVNAVDAKVTRTSVDDLAAQRAAPRA